MTDRFERPDFKPALRIAALAGLGLAAMLAVLPFVSRLGLPWPFVSGPDVPMAEIRPTAFLPDLDRRAQCGLCRPISRLARQFADLSNGLAADDRGKAIRIAHALSEGVRTCKGADLCSPLAGQLPATGQCPAGLRPLAPVRDRLEQTARRIEPRVALCTDESCPEIPCATYRSLYQDLQAVGDMTRALAGTDFSDGRAHEFLEVRRTLGQTLRQLDTALSAVPEALQRADGRITAPSALIETLANAESQLMSLANGNAARARHDHAPSDIEVAGLWRVPLLAIRIGDLKSALEALKPDAPPQAARMVGRTLSALLLDMARIWAVHRDKDATFQSRAIACRARRIDQANRLVARLESLEAGLNACGQRSGCTPPAEDDAPARTFAERARIYGAASSLWYRLDGLQRRADRLSARFWLKKTQPVTLSPDLTTYAGGEAIQVKLDMSRTKCMAEDGARISLLPDARTGAPESPPDPIDTLVLRGRPWEELYFEAPLVPGDYEFRTYAPESRGGGETGRAVINVTPPPARCDGFTGQWRTNFGTLRLVVRDGVARGTYRRPSSHGHRAGFLLGKVEDGVLTGQWQSELSEGGTRLTLTSSGRRFKGTWSQFTDKVSGTGQWTGSCRVAGTR